MKVELHAPDFSTPEIIDRVLNYQFGDDYRLLWLYDVKDISPKVTPMAVVNMDHWALVRFV